MASFLDYGDLSSEPVMDDFSFLEDVPIDMGTGTDTFSDALSGSSDSPWYQDVWNYVKNPSNWSTITNAVGGVASGVTGINQANQLQQLARTAMSASDPFGSQRAQYQQQLSALMANPSSVTSDPGYQASLNAGLDAVQRKMAAGGFLGSGNEATALMDYGQKYQSDYYNNKISQLAGLAGANISPNYAPGLSAYAAGTDTMSSALASLGYGLGSAVGGVTGQGASAGTPVARGGSSFSSAGGEAAGVAKTASQGLNLLGNVTGNNAFTSAGQGLGSAAGLISGIDQGGVSGYLGAAKSGLNLAKMGGFDVSGAQANLGVASNALGVYQGLEQGGVGGYLSAAGSASKLASMAGIGGIGKAVPVIGALSGGYNTIKAWESGDIKSGALSGMQTGAAIGSIIPGLGTVVGGAIGGAVGALGSALHGKEAPEIKNFDQLVDVYNQNPSMVSQIGNKYGALAGLFDLKGSQITGNIPMYKQYGRMGEEKFTSDMVKQIDTALAAGTITKDEDPSMVYNKVVLPWMNSFGKGGLSDTNAGAIQQLLVGMTGDYLSGNASSWKARSGDTPASFRSFAGSSSSAPITNLTSSLLRGMSAR